MTRSVKKSRKAAPGADATRQPAPVRQRQRLIDASITALHLYGPSGTTVARVVAIARLSPGIVRFYFRSKAAMLVASLQFLATEFEDRVMTPVAGLRGRPALALQRLVELYLDPDIASPRKVAVWYAFWGEASARQEYLAICGQKDANFAALVRDLIERMIEVSGRRHLDGEAVALGLIGVLEMLWQGFAFQDESAIDRALARRRCMAYLRSVFPREFGAADGEAGERGVPRRTQGDAEQERERCFRDAWQFVGHELEVPGSGDCVTLDLAGTRALVLRDAQGGLRAFRNACRSQPHALVTERHGRLTDGIACLLHGLSYGLDGRARHPAGGAGLLELEVHRSRGLIFVRPPASAGARPSPDIVECADAGDRRPAPGADPQARPVEADWKIVVMQLLESRMPDASNGAWAIRWRSPVLDIDPAAGTIRWNATGERAGSAPQSWRRQFLWPNVFVEQRAGVLSVLQVQPSGAGRSRVQLFEYAAAAADPQARADEDVLRTVMRGQLERELALAASIQQGVTDPGYQPDENAPPSPVVAAFRRMLYAAEA